MSAEEGKRVTGNHRTQRWGEDGAPETSTPEITQPGGGGGGVGGLRFGCVRAHMRRSHDSVDGSQHCLYSESQIRGEQVGERQQNNHNAIMFEGMLDLETSKPFLKRLKLFFFIYIFIPPSPVG